VAELLCPYSTARNLRSNLRNLLSVPYTHLKTRCDRAFESVAPKLWNALPPPIRFADSPVSFKLQLKPYLFTLAFGSLHILWPAFHLFYELVFSYLFYCVFHFYFALLTVEMFLAPVIVN